DWLRGLSQPADRRKAGQALSREVLRMGSQRVWLVRGGILLIGLPLLLWAVVELTLGFLNKARQYTTIAQDSRILTHWSRFCIESAEWKDGLLRITFCREDLERGNPMWMRGSPLLCHFWDEEGVKIPGWIAASDETELDHIVLETGKTERRLVTIRVPEEAES